MENRVENNYYFPAEVLTQIFAFVDLRTLVFSCRLVCSFWRDVVECSDLWKIKLFRALGDQFATNSALTKAHFIYPWYMCYALCRHVFSTNLFLSSEEIPGSPLFWRDADSPGFVWSSPLDSCTHGFNTVPHELIQECDNKCFLCVIGGCSINHSVDLYAQGLTRKILEFQPPIHISEWYGARYDYVAICHIEVKLFNSQWKCDSERDYFKYQKRIEWREWHKVSHTFTNYSPDVRYVIFNHGIDTCLPHFYGRFRHLDFGDAASKMLGTKLTVSIPEISGPSTSRKSVYSACY